MNAARSPSGPSRLRKPKPRGWVEMRPDWRAGLSFMARATYPNPLPRGVPRARLLAVKTESPLVLVSAAVIIVGERVLLTQRKTGTHLAGAWEFPGGKVEPDEDPRDALVRELGEEIGVEAIAGEIVEATFHRYPSKSVLILFYEARLAPGSPEPRALDVGAVRWAEASELSDELFPPADVAVLAKVRAKLASWVGPSPDRAEPPR